MKGTIHKQKQLHFYPLMKNIFELQELAGTAECKEVVNECLLKKVVL